MVIKFTNQSETVFQFRRGRSLKTRNMIFILEKSLDQESTIKHKAAWREREMKKIVGKKEKIKHLSPIESLFNALLRKLELKFEGPKSAKWSAQKGVGKCGELPIQWNRRD